MTHELKCWPRYFYAIESGIKTFEARKNDRDYRVGDTLLLWRTHENCATSEVDRLSIPLKREVTYILYGPGFGIEAGYCVMGIKEAQ